MASWAPAPSAPGPSVAASGSATQIRRWPDGVIPDQQYAVAGPSTSAPTLTRRSTCWPWSASAPPSCGAATSCAPVRCGTPTPSSPGCWLAAGWTREVRLRAGEPLAGVPGSSSPDANAIGSEREADRLGICRCASRLRASAGESRRRPGVEHLRGPAATGHGRRQRGGPTPAALGVVEHRRPAPRPARARPDRRLGADRPHRRSQRRGSHRTGRARQHQRRRRAGDEGRPCDHRPCAADQPVGPRAA